ncbi:MAG: T9SS type A sorting domain-containing protein [Flavobacterium sp.]
MKKLYSLLFIALTSFSFGQITDTFTGTGLLTANGWTNHNGVAGQLSISSGSIVYPGITSTGNKVAFVQGNSEDVHRLLPTAITGTTYFSVVMNFPTVAGLSTLTAGDYSISLGSGPSTATSAGSLVGRIYYKVGATADTFNIGILNGAGGTATPTYAPTDYPINVPLFLVVKYDIPTSTASLFIQPALDSTEPASATVTNNTGTSAAPTQVANIALRQAGTTAGSGNIEYDNIRVADNWAYVTTSTLGVNKNAIAGLSVFPNPVKNGVFYINTDANAERTVTVFDVLGKQVLNTTTSESAINVSNLTSGVYMVQISEEGNTATKKLVIE